MKRDRPLRARLAGAARLLGALALAGVVGQHLAGPNATFAFLLDAETSTENAFDAHIPLAAVPFDGHFLRITGESCDDHLGSALSHGDVNGSGQDDLIVGVDNDRATTTRGAAGAVYVFFGPIIADDQSATETLSCDPAGPPFVPAPGLRDTAVTDASFRLLGADASDEVGLAVAVGDVNGDGLVDIVGGAPGADGPDNGRGSAGEVYVIFGSASLGGDRDLLLAPADFTVIGADEGHRLGTTVDVGDVNGDGIGDLVMGAPVANHPGRNQAGKAFVVYGAVSLGGTRDLASQPADVEVIGARGQDELSRGLAAADADGDGIDDVLLGAPISRGHSVNRNQAGTAYVLRGGTLAAVIDLNTATPFLRVVGEDVGDRLGQAVVACDYNDDGTPDLIGGAPRADGPTEGRTQAGGIYVVLGPHVEGTLRDLDVEPADQVAQGRAAGDLMGTVLSTTDLNGDGRCDVAAGGPPDANSVVHFLFGRTPLSAAIDLAETRGTHRTIIAPDAGDGFSVAVHLVPVSVAGQPALAVGAKFADGFTDLRAQTGEVLMYSLDTLQGGGG